MAGHTPGPWRLDHERTIVDAHGNKLAETWPPHPDALPDARLMAAAPDLLDALTRYVLADCEKQGHSLYAHEHNQRLDAARAAIRKAETGA